LPTINSLLLAFLNFNNINKVLIIRLSSLGDVLLTTPLIRSLKNTNPGIQIDFIIKKQFADALKFNPHLRNLFLYDSQDEKNNYGIPVFSKNDYDLVIDLQNNMRSSQIRNRINSQSVKFSKPNLLKFLLVNFKINLLKDKIPIPVRYADSLENFRLDEKGLELYTKNKPAGALNEQTNYIGFCPGAKHFTKRWSKEYFIELGNLLSEKKFTIVLFGGKEDRLLCSDISTSIKGSIDLSNDDELLQTAADMKMCKLIVCNDSGLMHTGCAVGVPVAVIFGSTVQEFGFAPYNSTNLILENKSLFCRPCSHIGRNRCPKKHFKCMMEIDPQSVLQQILQFLRTK
jgi:heptosyltransferase-2